MKNRIQRIVIVLSFFTLFSCEEFLDKSPEDTLSPTVYYSTVDELKTGLAGCYKVLQSIYQHDRMIKYIGMVSDDGKDRQMTDPYHIFKKTNSQSASVIWTDNYLLIYRCNVLLDVLDAYQAADNDVEEVDAMKGECYFLRALAYMNLVRTYGDVPKVTATFAAPTDAFGIGRSSVSEIYQDVILPDFKKAYELCFVKDAVQLVGEEARANKGSALMGLAKAQLELQDYDSAQSTLKQLIVDKVAGEYELMPNLTDVFDDDKKFNSESIFEVNFNVAAGQPSYFFKNMTNDISFIIGTNHTTVYMVTHDLLEEYTAYDEIERLNHSVDSGYVEGATPEYQAFPKKMAPSREERVVIKDIGSNFNFIVYRYADALLMYAECLMNAGDKSNAMNYINQVRNRSEMSSLPSDYNLDIDWILHERRLELAFECHRYWDLKRTGKAIAVLSESLMTVSGEDYGVQDAPIEPYQLLFPIPLTEIEKDPTLPQNPGY